jgi:hypothetical protein
METERFEGKMALLAKKHGLRLEWQPVRFGHRRARFTCDSYEEVTAVQSLLRRIGGAWADSWVCFEGEFEGYVYAMARKDHDDLERQRKAESDRLEDWWLRYHLADVETRRLMACGEIE